MAIPIVQLEENSVRKYTKTHVAAVDGLSEHDNELKTSIQNWVKTNYPTLSAGEIIWRGTASMNADHVQTMSKKLSQCENGWLILFCPVENSEPANRLFCSYFFPKNRSKFTSQDEAIPLVNARTGKLVYKVLKMSDSTITGSVANVSGDNLSMFMVGVLSV